MPTTTKAKKAPAKKASNKVFSDAEMEAMQDAKKERKKGSKVDGLADLKAAIAKLAKTEQPVVERLHEIVMKAAPSLAPKTWYGMPAYSLDDKVVCFYKSGAKSKQRYATFGFSDKAKLDDGEFWPTDFAVKALTPAVEARIAALVKRAAG